MTTSRSWKNVQSLLAKLIDRLAEHPAGIRMLLGEARAPSVIDVAELFEPPAPDLDVRVDGGGRIAYAEVLILRAEPYLQAVESAGGWGHLAARCREYAEACPLEWEIFMEHVKWVRPGGASHIGGSRVERIADRFGVSGITVQRMRHVVPCEIARLAVIHPPEGENVRMM